MSLRPGTEQDQIHALAQRDVLTKSGSLTSVVPSESTGFDRLVFPGWVPVWSRLAPPVVPFCRFLGEGSPTKIDYRKKGALILTSLLEDLVEISRVITIDFQVQTGQVSEEIQIWGLVFIGTPQNSFGCP